MSWVTVTLGDCCHVIAGGTPKRSQSSYWGGGIPWVKISDMLQGTISATEETISADGLNHSSAKLLPKGTILISIFATIGRTAVLDCDAATNQAIVGIIPRDDAVFDRMFLLRCLNHKAQDLERKARGVAQANINSSVLKALELQLPPLTEQKRIAAILDAADALRTKRRESIEQLNSLIQATFLEMFGDPVTNPKGWEVKPLETLIQTSRPITYGILKPGPDVTGGVPYVRVVDIKDGKVLVSQLRRTTSEIASEYRRSVILAGDLLMSIRGHVGRMAIAPHEATGANITQDTARLALHIVPAEYMMQCLSSSSMQHYMAKRTKGVAVKGINLGDVKKIPIPVPTPELQTRFASIVKSIAQQKDRLKAHLAELDLLFASLQSRAFNGELVA
jgi:type I restriction enzyme S subunit